MKIVLKFGILEKELQMKIYRKYGKGFGNEIHLIRIEKVFDCDSIFQSYLLRNSDLKSDVKVKNENE
jgi:hypothetical protein